MTKEKTYGINIRINIPILIAVVLLFVSTVLIIITFAVIYWLYNIPNGDNYGMWQGCAKNASLCGRWYENGQTLFLFSMTPAFKAFQGLQVIFLVTIFYTVLSLLANMQFFPLNFWFYVINCGIIFISNVCAIASLLIFVINIYDARKHILGWCYWVQVGVIVVNLIALVIVCVYAIRLKKPPKEILKQSLIKNDATSPPQETNPQARQEPKMTKFKNTQSSETNLPVNSSEIRNGNTPRTPRQFRYQQNNFSRSNTGSIVKSPRKAYNQHSKRYAHKHMHTSTKEQFQPGYSSEPELIEYSLGRTWINNNNNNQKVDYMNEFESKIESEMLNVKLPRLIYYDGNNHYARSDFKKISG